LIPIDLEINATCRRRNAEKNRKFLQDLEVAATPEEKARSSEVSSRFPIPGKSHIDLIEEVIMAEEPRRVTLEDYCQVCCNFSPALHNQRFRHK